MDNIDQQMNGLCACIVNILCISSSNKSSISGCSSSIYMIYVKCDYMFTTASLLWVRALSSECVP